MHAAAAAEEARLFGLGLGPSGGVRFEDFVGLAMEEVQRRRARAASPPRSKAGKRAALRVALVGREEQQAREQQQARAAIVASANPVLGRLFNALDVEQRGALDLEQV